MQIIPAIDIRGGKCVRLRQGDYHRETVFGDDPVAMARRWVDEGAPRLHLVDLDGAKAGRPVNRDAVRSIVEAVDVPCQLGGGIRDRGSLQIALSDIGVDRVIIGTQALKEPEWFREMVLQHPRRIALGLDARDSFVATDGWLDVSQVSALELARQFADLARNGALAAVVYTNIANDGMLQGLDDSTLRDLVQLAELQLPVIASGGVSTLDDVRRLARTSRDTPNLVGAVIGRAIYEGTIRVAEAVRIAAEA